VRAFYARQKVKLPLIATIIRTLIFVVLATVFYKRAGGVGIAAIDSFSVTIEAIILFVALAPYISQKRRIAFTAVKSILGSIAFIGVVLLVFNFFHIHPLAQLSVALLLGTGVYIIFIIEEIRLLSKI